MVDLLVLPAFVGVILAFLAPPGPDMTYMIAVGLQGGRRAAARAILGIGTGMSVYAAAVVLGLARLMQANPAVLDAVRLGGAAFLVWMAWTSLRDARRGSTDIDQVRAGRWYVRGVIISLTNPKLILFFVAVLPQFIGRAESPELQLAMLGAVNVATEVLLYGAIGLLAGAFAARFAQNRRASRHLQQFAGAVYLLLALAIVVDTVRTQ